MAKERQLKRVGSLEVLEIPGQPGGATVVCLHGFGANAFDLASLGRLLSLPVGTTWLFPQGPLKVSDGGIAGYAWFPLDVEALDAAMRTGTYRDFSQMTPQGMKTAREQINGMLNTMNISMKKIILMGFSQGAMVATDVALRSSEMPLGLVILSGNLLNESLWAEKAKTKKGLKFFQSHGTNDALLSLEHARRLTKLLKDAGLEGDIHEFQGAHEIPQETIYKLNQFFKKIFSN